MSPTDAPLRLEQIVPGIGLSTPSEKQDRLPAANETEVSKPPSEKIQDGLPETFKVGPVDVDQNVGWLRQLASRLDGKKPILERLPGYEPDPSAPAGVPGRTPPRRAEVGPVETENRSAPTRSAAITLYRSSKDPELERLVIEAETKIRRLADKVRLRNPTSPPAPSPGRNASGPSGIGLTLEECRDNARRVEADGARLNGHAVALASICASAAKIQKDALDAICDKVDGLNESLRAYEDCQLPTAENRRTVLEALDRTLRSVDKIVNDAHELQKELAERAAPLRRESTDVADANSDRRPPASTANPPGRRVGGEPSTGDGEGDRPPGIQRQNKEDKLAGKESEREGSESPDRQGLRGQLDNLIKKLEGEDRGWARYQQPSQHGSAPRQNPSSWLQMLPVLAVTGAMAATGLAGPLASVAAAQQRAEKPEPERDLASADALPDDKSPPGTPPGAQPNGAVTVQPVKLEEVKTGDFTVDGPLIKLPDGRLEIVGPDGKQLPFDPNIPPNRGIFRASPVQVAAAPAPPTPAA